MKRFRDFSIKSKLTTIIVVITISMLGGAFAFAVFTQVRTYKRDMRADTEVMTRVLAEYSAVDLAFGDAEEAVKTLGKLKAHPDVQAAYLFLTDGKLLASWPPGVPKEDPPRAAGSQFRGGALHVDEPVIHEDVPYGFLHIKVSTRALDRKITEYVIMMLIGLAVLTALAYGLARWLQGVISRPLQGLADAAHRVSKTHDYGLQAKKMGNDEIGKLADAFNQMLTQIQEREIERDRADRRTQEKSRFLANMSHELRTPMNSVIGFSEVLLERVGPKLSPRDLKFLQNINTSGQHLLNLINDILDLSKIEAGKMELYPELFSLRSACDTVCQITRGFSSKRGVAIDCNAPDDLPLMNADPAKFKQILYNLLSNAVKFSPYNATVKLEVRAIPAADSPLKVDSIRMVVDDEGPGIDPKDHERIFQEFRQVEGGATGGGSGITEGTGLGLALVKKFVELHHGKVSVDSVVGEGTRFTVLLPTQVKVTPKAGSTVLVVEAEEEAWQAVKAQLEQGSYAAVWARDANQALRLARELKPSAITLDLVRPGPEGWNVLKALKAQADTATIPIIIVSVLAGAHLGPALGAADYFTSVEKVELPKRLESLLGRREAAPARVLVIDDDTHVHDLLDESLGRLYRLEHASSGEQGIERAQASAPDCILLDLLMEDMDGFEVAVRLHSDLRTTRIPVVLLTAKELTDGDRARLRGKVAAFVQKGPAAQQRLIAIVDDLLERAAKTKSAPA